jgi:hypothetical protein
MSSRYLPRRDHDLASWADNFSGRVAASPTDYGLTAAEVADLAARVSAYNARLATASEPATRTVVTVADKNAARERLVADIRLLARKIQATPTITPERKIALGLNVPGHCPSPVPPPATRPVLMLAGIVGNRHLIRISDAATPTRRSKPADTAGAEVFVYVGENPPADLKQWQYRGLATSAFYQIEYSADEPDGPATLVARWINRKGQPGPISDPITARIAATILPRAA